MYNIKSYHIITFKKGPKTSYCKSRVDMVTTLTYQQFISSDILLINTAA